MSKPLRRLSFGLQTLFGLAERGYFIPARHAGARGAEDYPALRPLFAAAEPQFLALLEAIEGFYRDLAALGGPAPAPRFEQTWFPRLDAAAAYALVRQRQPARIVEIGSGHSTRFLARAAGDGGFACRIDCIDPAPRAAVAQLPVTHHRTSLAGADPALLQGLAAGDMLFIDSSHVAMPGSDVDRLLLDCLPRLPAGVLVHIHDILLPDAYPERWRWRGYNEQLLVGCLLQGGGFALCFASHYVATAMAESLRKGPIARLPLPAGAQETSLWLETRRRAPGKIAGQQE
ncbi:MAG: class I SAM-dependent methyltransferase [Rhodospirillales bacterium]|nr:class I SAM-dependent methyltransferase [Rhodospirillales bacterium]